MSRNYSEAVPQTRMALSIKQPWATLVVHGIKTIEIRKWPSKRTGLVYIHAGRVADRRDVGWSLVPDEIREQTEFLGGLVGRVHMAGCKKYVHQSEFEEDRERHLNLPEWFLPPRLHGFVFQNAEPIPFEPIKGKLYFFDVGSKPASEANGDR